MVLFSSSLAAAGDDAKRHFAVGSAHDAAGAYEDALAAFQRAYAVTSAPELLYLIARRHEELGRYVEALLAMTEYLEKVPEEERRSDAVEKASAYRARAARLRVETNAKRAFLSVDADTCPADAITAKPDCAPFGARAACS